MQIIKKGIQFLLILSLCVLLFLSYSFEIAVGLIFLLAVIFYIVVFIARRTTREVSSHERSPKEIANIINAIKQNVQFPENLELNTKSPLRLKETSKNKPVLKSSIPTKRPIERKVQKQKIHNEAEDVVVSLSSKAKKIKKPIIESQNIEIGNLFDSDQEKLEGRKKVKPIALKKKKEVEKKVEKKNLTTISSETLNFDDFLPDENQQEFEARTLINKIEMLFKEKKYKEGLKEMTKWMSFMNSGFENKTYQREIIFLKGKLEFKLEKIEIAASTLKGLFNTSNRKKYPQYERYLKEVVDLFVDEKQFKSGIPFFLTALDDYRKNQSYSDMDLLYGHIANAYKQGDAPKRLIQTYQHHLSVKKSLEDFDGQLYLLDLLGKLYYDQEDKQGSKKCYEQSIALKKEMLSTVQNK